MEKAKASIKQKEKERVTERKKVRKEEQEQEKVKNQYQERLHKVMRDDKPNTIVCLRNLHN